METIRVKDIMVPLEDYASVSENATLFEAVHSLREIQKNLDAKTYKHRAVLVYDCQGKIVGKVSQFDVLRALEPKYQTVGDFKELDGYGINADYIRDLIKELGLLGKPLDDMCQKAAGIKVKNIMHSMSEGEYVDEMVSLNEAVLQLLVGKHQSLLVTRDNEITGILRLTDVFATVSEMISSCQM